MKLIPYAFLIFSLISCTDIQVSHHQDAIPEFEETAKVGVIFNRGVLTADDPEEFEEKIAECIGDELAKLPHPIQVVSPRQFRQTVFPGIAYDLIPSSPESITLLLDESDFQKKIESLGARYLILIYTSQKSPSTISAGGVGGGMGGGAGFLFGVWDNNIDLNATIMHLKRKMKIGTVSTKVSGHSFIGIFIIIPMAWPDTTEGSCCNAFSKEIASFFRNSQFIRTPQEKRR